MSPLDDDALFRWRLWRRVFAFRLMPDKARLDDLILGVQTNARRIWATEAKDALGAEYAHLFGSVAPESRALVGNLQRVGGFGYALATALAEIHERDAAVVHDAGMVAWWMAIAGGVMDHVLDTAKTSAEAVRAHLAPELLALALPLDPGVSERDVLHVERPDAPAALAFTLRAVDLGLRGIRGRLRSAPASPFRTRVRDELLACLSRMVDAEAGSVRLRMDGSMSLDEVEHQLRLVNTLMVWLTAYVGMLGTPPDAAGQKAVLGVTLLLGDVGWSLDALSDVHVDVRAGVWSRVWLELARRSEPEEPPWLRDRALAPAALEASPVLDSLLARIESALREIASYPGIEPARALRLADLCAVMVWHFLRPLTPEPPESAFVSARSARAQPILTSLP